MYEDSKQRHWLAVFYLDQGRETLRKSHHIYSSILPSLQNYLFHLPSHQTTPPFVFNMTNLCTSLTIAKESRARFPLNAFNLMVNRPADCDDNHRIIGWECVRALLRGSGWGRRRRWGWGDWGGGWGGGSWGWCRGIRRWGVLNGHMGATGTTVGELVWRVKGRRGEWWLFWTPLLGIRHNLNVMR